MFKSRRRRVIVGAVVLSLVAGVAFAAFSLRAGISGNGSVTQAPKLTIESASVLNAPSEATVGVVANANGTATVQLADLIEGEHVDLRFGVRGAGRMGAGGARIQGASLNGAPLTIGYMGTACGATVPVLPAAPLTVDVRITVPVGAPLGTFELGATAGLTAVDSASFVPGSCPSA